jgi:hypothetical protein
MNLLSTVTRISPRAVARLAREEIAGPVDVVNLITVDEEHFESYRWYGLLVAPALRAVGGSIRWISRHERSIHGERQADKLFVVRYPTHRRFLAMTLNPYYFTINLLRERGVTAFEGSFTRASHPGDRLRARDRVLVAHFNSRPGQDALPQLSEWLPGELIYATREVSSASYLRGSRSTDPRPLTYREVAFFSIDEGGEPDVGADVVARAQEATEGLSLQVYRAEQPRDLLPGAPRKQAAEPVTVNA